jgi:hypothetical protein
MADSETKMSFPVVIGLQILASRKLIFQSLRPTTILILF